jgi:O-antigen ligase
MPGHCYNYRVQKLEKLPLWSVYALLAYMPFHLFLSRWLSLYTGGLGIWDAGKDILTLLVLLICIHLALYKNLLSTNIVRFVFLFGALYGLLHLLFYIFNGDELSTRPLIVGSLYNLRFIAWFFIALVAGRMLQTMPRETLIRLILITSTITCLFALLQFVLPKDLMESFGYSIERGAKPSFFIDDKPDFPRVMSTVRDPNSYGAYLIVPIAILLIGLTRGRFAKRWAGPLLGLHAVALFLTFSRGAWLGAVLAISVGLGILYRQMIFGLLKKSYKPLLILLVCMATVLFLARDTYVFQNVILHSDESTVMADPNELRIQLQNQAIRETLDDPKGHGPGTAGLASIGNPRGTFLTENYYLQISHELGLVGLALFLGFLGYVLACILRLKDIEAKALLVGCFFGYGLMALLIHLWSNESVAAQWWLFSGIILGIASVDNNAKKSKKML